MLKIGLTGGIGSGKSTVAKIFEVLGIPVYYADAAAKQLMNENAELKKQLIFHFGKEVYTNNQLNRTYLASVVFGNTEKLELLNSLVHPVTIAHATDWFEQQHSPYVIKEAALLFESGTASGLDAVIGVTAPETIRIKRVMERDGIAADEVKKRMRNQIEDSIKMRLCDYIISNNEQEMVLPQVLRLHETLLQRAAASNKSQ